MKTLPNRVTVFNATPHVIRFWDEEWKEPVEVESDAILSAKVTEKVYKEYDNFTLVTIEFIPDDESAFHLIEEAYEMGADIVVGSIIAAQSYEGVAAMTPCEGYERVAPDQKRMRPDKFTVF